ncbi:MAG TPA: MoaD/ThiS family protein [Gemmatimonadaceae bacterium]|nr:MoaD/ThiS family protein [Gemmatimonadaceae bacterium]
MTVTALLFASYAEALGAPSVELALAPGAKVSDAIARLRAMPGGGMLPERPVVAVNLAYARLDAVLGAGDELAVIPPVAGG